MAETLKIWTPHAGYFVTQAWNYPNSNYDPLGFHYHNGIDSVQLKGNGLSYSNFLVYCPVENFIVDKVQYREKGGGNEIWLISKDVLQMGDKAARAYMVLCHFEKIFLKAGDEPALGQLIGRGDNTGFSTGPHLHMGLYRKRQNGATWEDLDINGASNSHNPALYMTGEEASRVCPPSIIVQNGFRLVQYFATGT